MSLLQVGYVIMHAPLAPGLTSPFRIPAAAVAAPYHGLLDATLAATLHAGGQLVFAWTPNAPADVQRVLDAGCDGVVTNEPARVAEAIQRRAQACAARAEL